MGSDDPFLRALNVAVQEAGMSQRQLSNRLRELGVDRGKDTVGLWLRGLQAMRPDEVFAVERALSLQPGELSQHLGYVPTGSNGSSVVQAIAADPELPERARRALRDMYQALRRR